MKKFIQYNNQLINIPNDQGETLLSYAIMRNKIDICEFILSMSNLKLYYYDKSGKSYLHKAVLFERYEIMEKLMKKGINLNCMDIEGNTPLHLAAIKGNSRAIKILVTGKAKIDVANRNWDTPIGIVKKNGNLRCINAMTRKKKFTNLEIDCELNLLLEKSEGELNRNNRNNNNNNFCSYSIFEGLLSNGRMNNDKSNNQNNQNIFHTNFSTILGSENCTTCLLSNNNSNHSKKFSVDSYILNEINLHKSVEGLNNSNIDDISQNKEEEMGKEMERNSNIQLKPFKDSPNNFSLKGSSSNNYNNSKDVLHPNLNFEKFINSINNNQPQNEMQNSQSQIETNLNILILF